MSPEEAVINPSSLTKFSKLRLKDTDLPNLLIGKTVTTATTEQLPMELIMQMQGAMAIFAVNLK